MNHKQPCENGHATFQFDHNSPRDRVVPHGKGSEIVESVQTIQYPPEKFHKNITGAATGPVLLESGNVIEYDDEQSAEKCWHEETDVSADYGRL